MKYNMVVLDLDGTLTNQKKEITPFTKEILLKYQKAGGCVVLASGRPVYGITSLAEELELKKYGGYILAFNGAIIIDCKTGETVFQKAYGKDMVDQIHALSAKYKTEILTYYKNEIWTEDPDNIYVQKEAAINHMKVVKKDDLSVAVDFLVEKILLVDEGDRLAIVEKKIQAEIGELLSVYRSEPYFLEIVAKGIDKASSLEKLLALKGMKKEEMAAFGDGYNDSSMIKFAGLGVAMENAKKPVKEVADLITKNNDEDGVAWVISEFLKEAI